MAIAQYSDLFWFPNGALASNIPARVFPESSNALAPLFTDATGTVPLPNPLSTDGAGVLTFWAESGDYWIHLDTESFLVNVGMTQEQADLSTGMASGGEISVNGVNPAALDISAADGYVVDYLGGTQAEPVITRVKTAAQTVPLDAAGLLRQITWWVLDSTGAVIQQASKPSNTQRRTHITLGVTAFIGGVIIVDQSLPVILPQPANQLADLMDALGPFVINGNQIFPNGINLSVNQTAGTLFSRAFNHFSGPVLTNDPHVNTTQAQTPAQFRYITSTGTSFGPLVTAVDVANFDSGGVITPIPGGVNVSSIHRVWLFATNTAATQLAVQYGQSTYANLATALDRIGTTGHVVNPLIAGNGALIAYIAATKSATDLSNPAQAIVVDAGKFATP